MYDLARVVINFCVRLPRDTDRVSEASQIEKDHPPLRKIRQEKTPSKTRALFSDANHIRIIQYMETYIVLFFFFLFIILYFYWSEYIVPSEDKTHTQTQFPLEYLTSSFVIPSYNSNVLSSSTSSYLYYILYTMCTYLCPIRTQQKITWMWVLALCRG